MNTVSEQPEPRRLFSWVLQLANVVVVGVGMWLALKVASSVPTPVPADWSAGRSEQIWILPALLLFDLVVVWFVILAFRLERPQKEQTLSVRAEQYLRERQRLSVRFTEVVILLANAGILASTWGGLEPERSLAALVPLFVLGAIAMVCCVVILVPALKRTREGLKGQGVDLTSQSGGWYFLGSVYYCPSDPALIVPKSMGLGATFNFARVGTWLLLGPFVLVPLAWAVLFY